MCAPGPPDLDRHLVANAAADHRLARQIPTNDSGQMTRSVFRYEMVVAAIALAARPAIALPDHELMPDFEPRAPRRRQSWRWRRREQ